MDSSTNSSSSSYGSKATCRSIELYSKIVIGFIGTALNLASMAVYANPRMSHLLNNKAKINNILLFKSLSDLITLFRLVLVNLIRPDWSTNYAYFLFAHIYTYYISFISQLSSMLFDVAVSFDRYVIVANRFLFFTRINYRYLVAVIYIYSALFYIFKFFQFNYATQLTMNKTMPTTDKSPLIDAEFAYSTASRALGIIHSIQRDFLCVSLIIVLNVLLLVKIKRLLNKKRTLKSTTRSSVSTLSIGKRQSSTTTAATLSENQREDSAELNLTIMVILTGLTAIIGHTTSIMAYLSNEELYKIDCFNLVNYTLYFLSYTVTFFFYVAFNKRFREIFLDYCLTVQSMIRRVKIALHDKLMRS